MLHGGGGIDGRGAFHIEALNEAGIATLEVDMSGMLPRRRAVWSLPYAYGALHYLSDRPEVDAERIGVMSFSFGAHMTIGAATAKAKEELGKGKGFVAHVPGVLDATRVVEVSREGVRPLYVSPYPGARGRAR